MPFSFRFQTLLKHREFLRKKAQIVLASALSRRDSMRAARQALIERIEDEGRKWDRKQAEGVSVGEYQSYSYFMRSLERQLLRFEGELKRVAQEIGQAQALLQEKERELKIVERLEETDHEVYNSQRARKEQGQSDEVAILKQSGRDRSEQ
ncbi:MAG: flagellar export protein FliJ [Syntrophobacteraceae bacterium]